MSLRTWSCRAGCIALVGLLVGCGAGSTTSGSASATSGSTGAVSTSGTGSSGSTSPPPPVTGVSTPKAVSVVTAN